MEKKLEKQFAELRSKTLRETNKSEKEIRKTYKAILKDLQGFIGEEYTKYSKDGTLTYSMLQQKGEYARFLKSVTDHLDGFTPEIKKEVLKLVDDVYELNYKGLVDVVAKSATTEELEKALASVKATTPSVMKKSVENKVDKLTLKDTLEYNRASITYNVRKQISMGLLQGDRYDDMAKRIANSLDGDYNKSIRIVRTEAHRVREQGLCESAKDCSDAVNKTDSGLVMVKIWRTGQDKRVRDTHSAMEGVTVLVDDEFELPSGAVTLCPGDSGVASEDVNCRCYCSYKLMTIEEYEKASGKVYEGDTVKTSRKEGIEAEEKKPLSVTKGYTDSENSYLLNEALRWDENTRQFEEIIERLDDNMTPLKADRELYRGVGQGYVWQFGINPRQASSMSFDDLKKALLNTEYIDKGYVSTTYNPDFTGHSSMFWIRVDAKKGTNAIVTGNDREYEVIIARNTKYKVKDVRMGEGNRIEIDLETIPDTPPKKKKTKNS